MRRDAASQGRGVSTGLRARLLSLLSIAVLPLTLVIIGLNLMEARQELEHHRDDARTFADLLVAEQTRSLASVFRLLEAVASGPQAGTDAQCLPTLERIQAILPEIIDAGIATADGRVICASMDQPPPLAPDSSMTLAMREALAERHPTVGTVTPGGERHQIPVYLPLPAGPGEIRVLYGTLDLDWVDRSASTLASRIDAAVLVLDRAGNLVTGYPDRLLPEAGGPQLTLNSSRPNDHEGSLTAQLADGRTYLLSFADVDDVGLSVAVGFRKDEVLEGVYDSVLGSSLIILLSLLLAGGMGLAYARSAVLQPVTALTQTARRLMAGDLGARVSGPRAGWEIAELADSFNAMAEQLQTREQQLRSSYADAFARERILAVSFDTSPDPVLVIAVEGHTPTMVELANRAAEDLLGWPPGTATGRPVAAMFGKAAFAPSPDILAACLDQDAPLTFECSSGSGASARIWSSRLFPLRDETGAPVRLFITANEVTTDRQREMILQEAKLAAEEAAQIKDRFLAIMSHEIRTPMTAVIGLADLLAETRLDPEQGAFVRTLRSSARALLSLLDDLLNFSKIQAGKLELEVVDTDLALLAEDVRSLFAPKASEKGLVLEVSLTPGSPRYVRLDPTRLRQVLFNLLSNAIKFTEAGRVDLVLSGQPVTDGRVQLDIQVTDTGIGMSQEQQKQLFAPFLQGDISTTRRFGGTGLGLSISQSLVQAMGGCITVTSEPDQGACFRFSITIAAGQPPAATPLLRPAALRAKPSRILLAEDNEANLALIAAMLRRQGHTVITVTDGEQALARMREQPVDLVLMDMQMPVMDGITASRAIRALPEPAGRVPIVALTADALPESRERYLRESMNGYVTKPVDWGYLHQVIAGFVGTVEPAGDESVAVPETTALESLETALGTTALDGLLDQLATQIDRQLPRLVGCWKAQDTEEFCRLLHEVTGAVANFGLGDLAAVLERMHAAARTGGVRRVPAADLDTMLRLGTQAQDLIRHWRRTHPAPVPTA
ncbi:ATP-binding protein [Oleisolibacter albus]|uniref:ATP-binding protein n=1 Tax=Oleisolibacter albus TaxID=2171757 RepID=UPI000DF4A846|nr:ATP-binding protein [Oleisolibacter albus]